MAVELYVNGAINERIVTGSSINPVTGAMVSTIGAVITDDAGAMSSLVKGDGWLSASLDDFRYWRRKRTPTQIGQHWFTQVGGGTNSDITNAATASTKYSFENPVDLGVYYKFNEGIYNVTATAAQDAVVLDYSGRTTNGSWHGYAVGSRFSGSAIVESSASVAEFKDPIIYSSHPDVVSLRTTKTEEGRLYDYQNNANIYHSYPSWILAEDEDKDRQPLKDLTQILASYFDTLHLQIKALPEIKNVKYPSGSDKPYPFANRLINSLGLVSSEIFANATDLEYLASKNDFKRFVTKLEETKNNIYQNIYNNLIYIYKSKGTEKSFRNLIRCFGVGEELVNINLYGSDITYELRNNADFRTVKKKYANFHNTSRFDATVFQETGSGNTNSRGYITSSISSSWGGQTYEAETIFPTQLGLGEPNYVENAFVTASIFGCHTSGSGNDWVSTSHITDTGQFQVQSVRPSIYSKDAYFQLTGSGYYQFDQLTSSLFKDVYDDSKWNFAVRIKPSKYPLAPSVSGSAGGGAAATFDLSFAGYNYVLDKMVNSFVVTSSASRVNALNFLTSSKRFFLGAHRTNFTSSVLQQSDAKISSMRVWMSYLEDETLKAHAQDVENFGSKYPYKSAYMSKDNHSLGESSGQIIVPQLETLVLNWNFDTVTSSNASGQFIVSDVSSGSTSLASRWEWLGNVSAYQYPGLGWGFPASATGSVSREYVYSSKQQLPETLNSSDMISLIDDTTRQMFTRDSRPIDYSFAFEKSMNAIVSQQMLNYFATIIAFNNLIGEPVNRYRQDYKDLEKLRALYFERVQNTPDFEKFVEFFKWIDMSLGTMLVQLAPASARFSEKLRTVVESHILERNKYWNKFPTLEMKISDPEAGLRGIVEMSYPGKRGLAPIPTTATGSNCTWWLDRAERDNTNITSGDSTIDGQRNTYRLANDFRSGSGPTLAVSRNSTSTTTTYEGNTYAIRNFTQPYRFVADESPEIHGGSNFPRAKTVEYTHEALKFGSSAQLDILASSITYEKDCTDVIVPNAKERLEYKVKNSVEPEGYTSGKGTIFAPFSMFSSSVTTGYASDVATNFRNNTEIDNYHDDIYGDDKGIPAQGPFTENHVGGRQHRHLPVVTASTETTLTRAEAWNLSLASNTLTITSRSADEPRAIYVRDEYAKRPLNIRNIKWGTGSATAGNYRKDYEMVQTSGRSINNRFFVDNEGFSPGILKSPYVSGVVDFALPRYDLTGSNKYIFVERFNAPGGPDASSRGSLDVYAEEYSVYNDLNYRNLIVRDSLNEWQTNHCGQFGINPTGSVGDGTNPGEHMTNPMSYDGVVAAYHKVNRNPGQTCLVKSGYDRYVNWLKLEGEITFDRTTSIISKPGGSSTGWNAGAVGDEKLPRNGYLSFEVTTVSDDQLVGLNADPPAGVSYTDMNYSIQISTGPAEVYIWEKGTAVQNPVSGMTPAVGDIFKIVRESTTVYYQRSTDGGKNFATFYTSGAPSTTDLYPDITLYDAGASVRNVKISNPRYDNWFVQHAIPQSALQYAWINASYDKSKVQPFGYVSNYLIPSGTTSTTQSAIQFATSSCWEPLPITNVCYTEVNFAQMEFARGATDPSVYKYTVTGSTNTITPGPNFLSNISVAPTINGHFSNLNGPYQYPSWKQIRTGETPIARYQRRNNILSVMSPPQNVRVPNGRGPGQTATYRNTRMDSYRQFIEPPVVFKYKPIDTTVHQESGDSLKLRSTYANNKCVFSQQPATTIVDKPNFLHPFGYFAPMSQSIAQYLLIPNETPDLQMYDLMRSDAEISSKIVSAFYNEVVYPREANTGLAKTRGRTAYAETALVNNSTPPTASLSDGTNGIDRSPLYRRTLWRDKIYDRNRYGAPAADSNYITANGASRSSYPWFTTTIPNSCNNKDGQARSVWCFGEEPLVWAPPVSGTNYYLGGNLSASGDYASNNGQDTGELNSINIMKIGGMMGGVSGSALTASFAHQFYTYPSASAFYYWLPYYGDEEMGLIVNHVDGGGTGFTTNLSKGMKWTAARDSGLKPWFDSYEEYAEDIRGLSKAWTVLPEFKISDSMPYYVQQRGGNFRAQNDKFLSLNGASITQSAQTQTNNTSASWHDGQRNFNEHFFKEYSFSDFQKYFGTFYSQDQGIQEITLKCNAVKKLLPYKGFYPADRTTQLVSLFSGALGQYVTGGAVTASQSPQNVTHRVNVSGSQQLAMQALLQPWFAPGILYNTVKSGIAVDWPVLTGSYEPHSLEQRGSGFIRQDPNTRFPFKSLLDPLDYIPPSASNGDHKLMFLAPSYQKSVNHFSEAPRIPFAEFINPGAISHNATPADSYTRFRPDKSVLDLYSSAMHNFLAEIPNFFLKGNGLKTIESRPQWSITIGKGTVYVMDVYIQKTNNAPDDELIMIDDYYNGTVSASFEHSSGTVWGTIDGIPSSAPPIGTWTLTASYNGKYFGPIWSARNDTDSPTLPGADWYERRDGQEGGYLSTNAAGRACDPGHAPCTPPYFYGKSRVRLIYTGSAEDAQREGAGKGPNFRKVFNNMTMSFKGVDDPRITAWTKFSSSLPFGGATNQAQLDTRMEAMTTTVAFRNMMDVTASLELKGIKADQPGDDAFNRWIISPLMETPVLDFSESQARELGYGRGMWSGYGRIPENKEIAFGIEFPGEEALGIQPSEVQDMTKWFQDDERASESFSAEGRGDATVSTPTRQKVGELAPKKEISEAIVAIPFIGRQMLGHEFDTAGTIEVPIMDKYFFSLAPGEKVDQARAMFNETKKNLKEQGIAIPADSLVSTILELDSSFSKDETSISQMVERMQEYVIPPELDFNQFSDIEPFVMYIIPFKHEFNDQDLADIWQGLMPRISRTAELDTQIISHKMDKWEFFGGKQLPKDPEVRWMVFKVKKQAAVNYFDITPSVDDRHFVDRDTGWTRFMPNKFPYAYNWPYDYCSLVELAQLEVGTLSGSS